MNKIIRSAALIATLAVASVANASEKYNFSYTFTSGDVVTGSFYGDVSGNVVTNLTDITASLDGVAFSGSLYGSSFSNTSGWTSGGAVASFDGTQNNLLFIDVDYPNSTNYSNYFYSVLGGTASWAYNENSGQQAYDSSSGTGTWTLSAAVPEPANGALLVAGLGLMGLMLRRKSAQK